MPGSLDILTVDLAISGTWKTVSIEMGKGITHQKVDNVTASLQSMLAFMWQDVIEDLAGQYLARGRDISVGRFSHRRDMKIGKWWDENWCNFITNWTLPCFESLLALRWPDG